jgi:hypothetical protein
MFLSNVFWIIISRQMRRKFSTSSLIIPVILAGGFFLTSCTRNKTPPAEEPPVTQSSPAPSPKTGFEADLEYVRKGQYTYVWVFSRRDGKAFDKDDGAFLRKNAPQVVDWVTSEQGKKVIAGTNFDLAQGNLELIKKRFVAEDYSGR